MAAFAQGRLVVLAEKTATGSWPKWHVDRVEIDGLNSWKQRSTDSGKNIKHHHFGRFPGRGLKLSSFDKCSLKVVVNNRRVTFLIYVHSPGTPGLTGNESTLIVQEQNPLLNAPALGFVFASILVATFHSCLYLMPDYSEQTILCYVEPCWYSPVVSWINIAQDMALLHVGCLSSCYMAFLGMSLNSQRE